MTLVDPSLLPTTFPAVFGCGTVPTDVCVSLFVAHGINPVTMTVAFPFLDNGAPSASPPSLDTPFAGAPATGGDSVVIFPGGTITMTVTAPPGTVLHFMCVIHPWMQGEIIVDP